MWNTVRCAKFVGELITTDAMTGFQGTRRIVQTRVNDTTIARARPQSNPREGLQNEHITPLGRESSSHRAAYDATTDDHYIGLFHGLQFIRIVVPVANFALKTCARLHQKPPKTRTKCACISRLDHQSAAAQHCRAGRPYHLQKRQGSLSSSGSWGSAGSFAPWYRLDQESGFSSPLLLDRDRVLVSCLLEPEADAGPSCACLDRTRAGACQSEILISPAKECFIRRMWLPRHRTSEPHLTLPSLVGFKGSLPKGPHQGSGSRCAARFLHIAHRHHEGYAVFGNS
jgi:hypothetical protein